MARSDLRMGLDTMRWARIATALGGLALPACGGEGAPAGAGSMPRPTAMNPVMASDRGETMKSDGGEADAPIPPPAMAGAGGARAAAGRASPPRAGMSAPPRAGSPATNGAAGMMAAAAGSTAPAGGALMYTGELTQSTVIPQKYKCLMPRAGGNPGENKSPPLAWTGGPAETQSFALIVYDVTYSQFHWAVWDIPATVHALPEAMPMGYDVADPAGAHQYTGIARATDEHMYYGPCSGGQSAGTYEFRLFALSKATLGLGETSDAQAIQSAIDAALLDKVIWAGMPD